LRNGLIASLWLLIARLWLLIARLLLLIASLLLLIASLLLLHWWRLIGWWCVGSHSLRSSEPLALTRTQAEEHYHSGYNTNEETYSRGYTADCSGSQASVVAIIIA